MGTPAFALDTLKGLIDSGVDLCAVYTQPDRPKGRGRSLTPPPVKVLAEEHGIAVFQPAKLRAPEAVEQLRSLEPDLIVVVAYGQILPKSVLEIPECGCINVHASLLPRYRGAAPINKAIIDGEEATGITTMLMDEGLDTGDMLVKKTLPIGPEETAGELHDRLALLGRETMEETLARLCAGTLKPQPQDDSQSSYAPMLKKEDGRIAWTRSAEEIHNQVRGLDPWPGAYTRLDGDVLKLFATSPQEGDGEPGTVVSADAGGVRIACGEGILLCRELQLPGKKRLPAADFLRGRTLSPGTRLEP
ncbi:MAG: methionyl-tRNA formyltransferase [Desulfuromonadales bacterium]|nr:methionyl-tRNA formyltransferase [Desulfuromonadales bacterium]NIR33313.1 methionyl-tRNA formyltransferase [Desulfuromonadales bacterium]NIS42099.1 methionyl-tRNA formyltransferase [Desulfuromonadales bacterium]